MNIQRKNSAHHFRMQSEREQTLGPRASSCTLDFCSTVTHIVHHKTCSVTTHAQSHLMLRPRMAAKRKCSVTNKKCLLC